MPTLDSLSRAELAVRLSAGLHLRTGPFVTCIRSPIGHIAEGLARLYGDCEIGDDGYADFYMTLRPAGGLRRWFRPQVVTEFDGASHFLPMPLDQAFPMLEWMMNWCISSRAHRYLIIHAAVVEKNGGAAILPAPPGSGKSTLCALLVNAGWRLLSDELTLIGLEDGLVAPVPRPISLKNGSIDVIRGEIPHAVLSRPVHDTLKGTIAHLKAPAQSVARSAEPAKPAWVVYPKYEVGAATALTSMARADSFISLAENSFNYSVLGAAGFELLGNIIDRCDSYQFSYSAIDEAIEVFEALSRAGP